MVEKNAEAALRNNSRSNLGNLLQEMIERPEEQDNLTEKVERDFGQIRAVLVLDMSGFSRTTQRHGIVTFLLMIHQMRIIATPIVVANGGVVVKYEADNLYCLFDTVAGAVGASREIIQRLEMINSLLPEERRLYASIGIGYGSILNVADEDLFGSEVNLASKLGEDIAERGEILLTEAARAEADLAQIPMQPQSVDISGMSLSYFSLA